MPWRHPVCPDADFSCTCDAWACPEVPQRLRSLAPRLAPWNLVSNANVQADRHPGFLCQVRSEIHGSRERRPHDEASLLSLLASSGG